MNRCAKVGSRAFACNCCAKAALQNYFLSFCVELTVVQMLRWEAVPQPLAWSLQKLPFETIAHAFAWHLRARVAFRSYFLGFCMELSCEKVSHRAVSQHLIWNCRAKELSGRVLGRSVSYVGCRQISVSVMLHAALVDKLRSHFLSFCMELLCKSCLSKLFLQLFVWNCRAKVGLRGYLSR